MSVCVVSLQEVTRYNWTSSEQIQLISAYYMGYMLTNLCGGFLCQRMGATNVVLAGMTVAVISNAVIPLTSNLGYYYLFALRIINGLFEVNERYLIRAIFIGHSLGSL